MIIKRGDVFFITLDPAVGSEISKTRPGIVVSNDKNNEFSGTVTILPVTSGHLRKIYPFEVLLPRGTANLPKDSKVKADQIRTLDRSRLVSRIGRLDVREMARIEDAMKIHLGLS